MYYYELPTNIYIYIHTYVCIHMCIIHVDIHVYIHFCCLRFRGSLCKLTLSKPLPRVKMGWELRPLRYFAGICGIWGIRG